MAWYKCGGGGIPSSLKDGMNGVLNKKFGTSTMYAPDTWVDNVNLMGKLPEKTVSGSIANISDGADRVPMKNLVCDIDATLDGVSSVEVVQTGKNLAIFSTDILNSDRTQNGVTFHALSENTVRISGTATGGSAFLTNGYVVGDSRYRFLKKGTYTLSTNMPDNGNYTVANVVGYYEGDTSTTNFASNAKIGTKRTFTLTNDAFINIQIYVTNTYSVNQDVWVQIEVGSTATTYTQYVAPTTKTVPLGQTVYGGTVDVVTGELTIDRKLITFDGSSDEGWTKYHQQAEDVITFRIPMPDKVMEQLTSICDNFENVKECWTKHDNGIFSDHRSQNLLFFRPFTDDITEVADWRSWLSNNPTTVCYKLVTPVTYQLTPQELQTLLGANNIWNNTGDTSVTYRRDIELALSAGAPLMMMAPRPTTVPDPEEIPEEAPEENPEEI